MYKITEQQYKDLASYINTIPTQYGMPLINFLNTLEKEKPKEKKK